MLRLISCLDDHLQHDEHLEHEKGSGDLDDRRKREDDDADYDYDDDHEDEEEGVVDYVSSDDFCSWRHWLG